jgi:hypothetical protein
MDERERLARQAAFWHGQKKISNNETLAAINGFGSFGHSAELYADKRWHEYTAIADMIIEQLHQETARCATIAESNRARRTAAEIRRKP